MKKVWGNDVNSYLIEQGVQTPTTGIINGFAKDKIEDNFREILGHLHLNLNDDSLCETPRRVAKMFVDELFWGLDPNNFPEIMLMENKMGYDEMVLEMNISVKTVCEHHFQNIFGVAHIAYIPNEYVIGLSKLNRVTEYFCRRPQIQERLVEQIYHALSFILGTEDVAVVIDAEHFCVKQRGVEDTGSSTITSRLGGCFKKDISVRSEFMSLIKG